MTVEEFVTEFFKLSEYRYWCHQEISVRITVEKQYQEQCLFIKSAFLSKEKNTLASLATVPLRSGEPGIGTKL